MNRVKAAYEDGICPDCGIDIPDDVEEGEGCKNCEHVFWSDDEYGYDGDDVLIPFLRGIFSNRLYQTCGACGKRS